MNKRPRSPKIVEKISGKNFHAGAFRRIALSCGVMIFLIVVLLYAPALKNSFVNLDDGAYVYENSSIRSLSVQSVRWMLTTFHAANWHPLTWLSHAVDYAFYGLNPPGHHLTSIILHGLNTLLVFLLSLQLMLRATAHNQTSTPDPRIAPAPVLIAGCVTSLLFGIHPVHVESVAWLAERKDVLCAFFFLLTLCTYIVSVSCVAANRRRAWFTLCVLFTAAALAAKPMAVTLPLVLLLLDIYPLRRISFAEGAGRNLPVVLEKAPFFLLSSISAILTILAQHAGGALESLERVPLYFRFINALHASLFYLAKMLWPVGLVPYYAIPKVIKAVQIASYSISFILFLSITGWCMWQWKRGRLLFPIVWAYYLITLLPVAGIIQVGSQAAADRYTYLPSVSIFLLAGLGIAQLFTQCAGKKNMMIAGGVCTALIFAAFGQRTLNQIKVWHDSETLWGYVIKTFPGRVPIAHNNLGVLYDGRGLHDKALEEYEKAIAINPTFADAHNNLGVAYKRKGNYDRAMQEYQRALAGNPNLAEAHNNLGLVYYAKGLNNEAITAYEKALAINPAFAEAHFNLGLVYYAQGMYDTAVEQYKKALEMNPSFADAHYRLGLSYYENKDYTSAKIHIEKAQKLGYKVDAKIAALLKLAP